MRIILHRRASAHHAKGTAGAEGTNGEWLAYVHLLVVEGPGYPS